MKELVKKLLELLIEKKLTVAFAESVTCGLASHQLNITEGTSAAFMGSIVCYNEKVKTDLLKINPEIIEQFTAESQEVTDALVKNLPQLIPADIHVAVTGLASDGGSETPEKPVGTVFISMLFNDEIVQRHKHFQGSAIEVKENTCLEMYRLIIGELEK